MNKIRPWEGPFHSGHGIKCKISWPRALCDADFYVKKSGNAVACTSVAPMRLRCPICHAGINIQVIIAQQIKNGEVLLHYWHLGTACRCLPFWGLFYKHGKTPQ